MAIAKMAKVMIVTHRSQAAELLEAVQSAGICHILDTSETSVSLQYPDLKASGRRPTDIEGFLGNLRRSIEFLRQRDGAAKYKRGLLTPAPILDKKKYLSIVDDSKLRNAVDKCITLEASIEKAGGRIEELQTAIAELQPWKSLETPVENLGGLEAATCVAGFVPANVFDQVKADVEEAGAVVEVVGRDSNRCACLIVCFKESADAIQKTLRAADFAPVNFAGFTGTVAEMLTQYASQLDTVTSERAALCSQAGELTENLPNLEILLDHTANLLEREQAHSAAPATEKAVILEGWVKTDDFARLKDVVTQCGASDIFEVEPAEDELPPVEIENKMAVKPFEVITRLYGMPHTTDVDPTVFLAPFFALFFGICMTDALYGVVMLGFFIWLSKKIKFAKRFSQMMIFCSVTSIFAGALTGSWCADAIGVFWPGLEGFRQSVMWFDPLEKPMYFFVISLALGYLQIIFGVAVAFHHKLKRGETKDAICDHLTWLIWLNALVVFGLGKAGYLPAALGTAAGCIAIVPAVGILLFSEREGGMVMRIGMGAYNLFSTVFYVGDVLSYIRLMALGMVTAGFGMAINVISKQLMDINWIGWIAGAVVFVGGHVFNIANSALSAFVHSMRLQFVEFFTKFIKGGGKNFEPLRKEYKSIEVEE